MEHVWLFWLLVTQPRGSLPYRLKKNWYLHPNEGKQRQTSSHQGGEGVSQPPVQGQGLELLEELVVVEGDRIGRDELLHAVLPSPVRVS